MIWFHAVPAGSSPATSAPRPTRAGRCSRGSRAGHSTAPTTSTTTITRGSQVKAGNGYLHRFSRVPDHALEHGIGPRRHFRDGEPDLDGRPRHQKVFSGIVQEIDIRPARCCSSGTAPATSPTATAMSRCRPRRPAMGLVPHQRRPPRHGRQPVDQLRFTWTTYKVSLRTGKTIWELGGKQSSFKLWPPPGRTSTAQARFSRSSTTRRPSGTACTRSSTTSPTARPCYCPTAGSSPSSWIWRPDGDAGEVRQPARGPGGRG